MDIHDVDPAANQPMFAMEKSEVPQVCSERERRIARGGPSDQCLESAGGRFAKSCHRHHIQPARERGSENARGDAVQAVRQHLLSGANGSDRGDGESEDDQGSHGESFRSDEWGCFWLLFHLN